MALGRGQSRTLGHLGRGGGPAPGGGAGGPERHDRWGGSAGEPDLAIMVMGGGS